MNDYKLTFSDTLNRAVRIDQENTFTFKSQQIANITVIASDNKKYIYEPKDDITNYELAMMLHMFVFFHINYGKFDYWEFITRNKLERHFKEINDE